ncbi:MAG: NAD-dependent epimerase/dehydratase family protein [Oscillatoria sp. PMC 1068.18]|nr:NAD-dependent epimerase/dehydratase family protein [Oscillatoria sp. PMC 1076.18]MEC4991852.1 NAD-dependent epimerase/dehydratase family protein [Oscillatoria sp. PMC 1068.18]
MKVAIIGCGYVGTEVARYWSQEKDLVVTVTTTTNSRVAGLENLASQVVVVRGNDRERLKSVVAGQELVLLSVGARNAASYRETYLGTAETLVSVLQETPTVRQLIYTSSYSVFGDRAGAVVDETSPVKPANENGQILAETEKVLLSAATEKLKVCLFRLGGIYGRQRELVKIFSRVAGTTRPGQGDDATNWIHLDDIVAAIEFARIHQLEGVYNLVDDDKLTSGELINAVLAKNNLSPVNWDTNQKSPRPYNARVSNQKLKNLGFQLIHPQTEF